MTAEFISDHICDSVPNDPNRLIRIRRGMANLGELTDHEERPTYHIVYRTASGEAEWIFPIHVGVPAVRTVLDPRSGQDYDQSVPSGLTIECLLAIALDRLRIEQSQGLTDETTPIGKIKDAIDWLHEHPTYIPPNPTPLGG